jgi:hypothetical protein
MGTNQISTRQFTNSINKKTYTNKNKITIFENKIDVIFTKVFNFLGFKPTLMQTLFHSYLYQKNLAK